MGKTTILISYPIGGETKTIPAADMRPGQYALWDSGAVFVPILATDCGNHASLENGDYYGFGQGVGVRLLPPGTVITLTVGGEA